MSFKNLQEIIQKSIEFDALIIGTYVREVCLKEKLDLPVEDSKNINFFFTDFEKYKRFLSIIKGSAISIIKESKNKHILFYLFRSVNFKVLVTYSSREVLPLDFVESSLVYRNGNKLDVIHDYNKKEIIQNILYKTLTITPEYYRIIKQEVIENKSNTKYTYLERLVNDGWKILWLDDTFVTTSKQLKNKFSNQEHSISNTTKFLFFLGVSSILSLLYLQH